MDYFTDKRPDSLIHDLIGPWWPLIPIDLRKGEDTSVARFKEINVG